MRRQGKGGEMKYAIQNYEIGINDKFVRRDGSDIAIVVYRSVDNSVGYRIKGAKRIYSCAPITFLRNWQPIQEAEARHANDAEVG